MSIQWKVNFFLLLALERLTFIFERHSFILELIILDEKKKKIIQLDSKETEKYTSLSLLIVSFLHNLSGKSY